ncbi:MAG: hypothetical protein ACPGRC_08350 [Salibacteraceae bacterium]
MPLKINKYHTILIGIFGLMFATGFISLEIKDSIVSVKKMLVLSMFAFTFFLGKRVNKKVFEIWGVFAMYILYSLVLMVVKKINLFDYFTVFLAFFYAFCLFFFAGKKVIKQEFFDKFFSGLLIMFSIKYLITILTTPYRPILFIENNFELLFMAILLIGSIRFSEKINYLHVVLSGFIAISSTSRSGAAIFIFLLGILFFKWEYIKLKYWWVFSLILVGVGLAVMQFINRIPEGGIEQIDRFRFLVVFFSEIKNWGLWEYLFGNPIITPLSIENCGKLSYYQSLFSFSGTGDCYSVVLHSFILRVILDHGFLGLILLFFGVYKMFKVSGFPNRYIWAIIGVLFLNSISISSINSIFAVFAMGLIMIVKPREKLSPIRINEVEKIVIDGVQ